MVLYIVVGWRGKSRVEEAVTGLRLVIMHPCL